MLASTLALPERFPVYNSIDRLEELVPAGVACYVRITEGDLGGVCLVVHVVLIWLMRELKIQKSLLFS